MNGLESIWRDVDVPEVSLSFSLALPGVEGFQTSERF
jgi:hypothetical protein